MKKIILTILISSIVFHAPCQEIENTKYPKTITVSGSAEMEIVPDEIYVQVDLKEYKKKGENLVNLEKIKNDFLDKCKKIGLADSLISIASYEGNNFWLQRKRKKDTDLLAGISYQLKFQLSSKIDQLVELLDDEATTNFRIVKTSHSKMIEYRKQLKIQAIKAAREKSNYLAEAIGEKAGEAVRIVEPSEDSYALYENQVLSQYSNMALGLTGESFPDKNKDVDFKKIKLRYEVSVVFALK